MFTPQKKDGLMLKMTLSLWSKFLLLHGYNPFVAWLLHGDQLVSRSFPIVTDQTIN